MILSKLLVPSQGIHKIWNYKSTATTLPSEGLALLSRQVSWLTSQPFFFPSQYIKASVDTQENRRRLQ